jgi:hypothetical protein
MKLNDVCHLIIYGLNCIRRESRDQNSTYKTGLRLYILDIRYAFHSENGTQLYPPLQHVYVFMPLSYTLLDLYHYMNRKRAINDPKRHEQTFNYFITYNHTTIIGI